jgi:hypothetical protein
MYFAFIAIIAANAGTRYERRHRVIASELATIRAGRKQKRTAVHRSNATTRRFRRDALSHRSTASRALRDRRQKTNDRETRRRSWREDLNASARSADPRLRRAAKRHDASAANASSRIFARVAHAPPTRRSSAVAIEASSIFWSRGAFECVGRSRPEG